MALKMRFPEIPTPITYVDPLRLCVLYTTEQPLELCEITTSFDIEKQG